MYHNYTSHLVSRAWQGPRPKAHQLDRRDPCEEVIFQNLRVEAIAAHQPTRRVKIRRSA
jgi:hypothetical protein